MVDTVICHDPPLTISNEETFLQDIVSNSEALASELLTKS